MPVYLYESFRFFMDGGTRSSWGEVSCTLAYDSVRLAADNRSLLRIEPDNRTSRAALNCVPDVVIVWFDPERNLCRPRNDNHRVPHAR